MFDASALLAGFNPGRVSVLAGGVFSVYYFFISRNGEELLFFYIQEWRRRRENLGPER